MKSILLASTLLLAVSTQVLAQAATSYTLDVFCVDGDGIRTSGKATLDSSTNSGTLTFQYMAQGSPAVTVPVIYKSGTVGQGLENKDASIVIGNGTGDAESPNRLAIQEMIGGKLVPKTGVNPGNCSLDFN